jgi:hypothetical protein
MQNNPTTLNGKLVWPNIFGEAAGTLFQCRCAGINPPGDEGEDIAEVFLDFLETGWERPDNGIWEMCGPQRHFVPS